MANFINFRLFGAEITAMQQAQPRSLQKRDSGFEESIVIAGSEQRDALHAMENDLLAQSDRPINFGFEATMLEMAAPFEEADANELAVEAEMDSGANLAANLKKPVRHGNQKQMAASSEPTTQPK